MQEGKTMNCKDAKTLLREDFDAALNSKELMEHLSSCESCKALYQYRLDAMHLDDEENLPADFSSSWRESIIKEEKDMEKERKKLRMNPHLRRFISIAAVFMLLVAGTFLTREDKGEANLPMPQSANYGSMAKGAGYDENFSYSNGLYESGMDDAAPAERSTSGMDTAPAERLTSGMDTAPVPRPQKLIRTLNLDLSTRNFDEDLQKIQDSLPKFGGYAEYLRVGEKNGGRRFASITIRVPQDRLDAFQASLEKVGRTVSKTESSEDISERYYDTQTRLETQEAKMKRLQDMMEKAKSIKELIQIEDAIADTQYQIDSLTGSLKNWDSKVNYSTVNLELLEERQQDIVQVKEATLIERMESAFASGLENFKEFFEDMLVFIVSYLPAIAVIIVVVIIANIIIKKRRNKNEK
jgi:hypothetical protein